MNSPRWFRVIVVLAILWNLLGFLAFVSDLLLTPDEVAKLPESQQALYAARPGWTLAATATAVIGGIVGCVALLLGKKWAFIPLILSLAGIVIQDFGLFVLMDGASLAGPVPVILQAVVFAIGLGLVLLARKGMIHGWLT